ncbi:hypothetical protein B0O99DRAFT_616986 [Bisporella sp. PMI_857]|nr:hypothetical protein B0O99DRAFT_616986 [Bisporella sp. PMI_857]
MAEFADVTPDDSHVEKIGYLFGHPIAHSLSPLFHQTIYDTLGLKWAQLPLDSVNMPNFLRLTKEPKFYGSSVTMPHKIAIIPHVDKMTQEAREIGACNTVYIRNEDGKRIMWGTNTDCVGIREAFYQNLLPSQTPETYRGKPGMVIGGGGACRSAVYALKRYMGCSPIYVVNRDVKEVEAVLESCKGAGYGDDLIHVRTADQASSLASPAAIVACIPNFPPKTPEEIEARKIIETFLQKPEKGAILEMCYHPTPFTEIAAISEKEGWQVILGTEAMIYQGLEQSSLWTLKNVKDLPVAKVKEVVAAALKAHAK